MIISHRKQPLKEHLIPTKRPKVLLHRGGSVNRGFFSPPDLASMEIVRLYRSIMVAMVAGGGGPKDQVECKYFCLIVFVPGWQASVCV